MGLLELIIVIVLIAWLSGWGFSIGGSLIHLLLVIAVILLIYRFFIRGRDTL